METHESREYFVHQFLLVKGICILGVVAIHVSSDFTSMSRLNWLTGGLMLISSFSRFAVPVFIILSGFYLSLNPRNTRALPFYGRTLKFLVIPYFFYSVFYTMLKYRSGISFLLLVKNLLLGSASPHLWFGLTIIQAYLLHPFLFSYYRKCKYRGLVVIMAFAVQILWSVAFSIFVPNPDIQRAGSGVLARIGKFLLPSSIGFFFLGYHLAAHSEEAAKWFKRSIVQYAGVFIWIAATVGSALYWGIPMSRGIPYSEVQHAYLGQSILVPLMSAAALAAVFSFTHRQNQKSTLVRNVLHRFGLYSYGIYYLNPLFVKILSKVIRQVPWLSFDSIGRYLILFFLVPFTTLLAVKCLSKLPSGKYLQ
jgi:surface polysaccharide O-acyltransferase-like enzyme